VRVLGEVAGADVLPVAAEICEGKRLLVDDAEEAGRSATMLDIGLPVLARGGDIEGAHARDELREVRINGGAESALVPIVVGFLDTFPQITARLLLVDPVVDLIEEGLDLGADRGCSRTLR